MTHALDLDAHDRREAATDAVLWNSDPETNDVDVQDAAARHEALAARLGVDPTDLCCALCDEARTEADVLAAVLADQDDDEAEDWHEHGRRQAERLDLRRSRVPTNRCLPPPGLDRRRVDHHGPAPGLARPLHSRG